MIRRRTRIVREVGRGGMGVVYEAVEEALGRTVALKVVAPERAREEGFRERFVAESRMAASLDHPNVLPVFGAGETDDGTLWLSMRLVDGADLRSLAPLPAAGRPRSWPRSARRWTPRTSGGSCTATSSPPTSSSPPPTTRT